MDNAMRWLDEHQNESIERLMEWLRIPSVSTDPAFREDVRSAAQWAADHLRASGLDVEICETGDPEGSGHPVVLATTPGEADAPHVLFYGHYDVQPADPLELWNTGPFEPFIAEPDPESGAGRRVVARGACDDKGQVMTFLEALRAWSEAEGKPAGGVRMTVLLEGEEESGSVNLERFVRQRADQLRACDVCVISDTGMLDRNTPAITYGIRGLTYTEVTLHGPDQDLHSGLWGGRCPNPNNELVRILGQLWDAERRVTIPGFYDTVRDITEDERARWAALPFSQADALASIGLPPEADVGEAGFSALEREWARPTAEINGIFGGYTGAGAKTVIPAHATAKVSFRLVADQDPGVITKAFFAWLEDRTPPGCRWECHDHGGGLPAAAPTSSPYLSAASRAMAKGFGIEPELIKTGGSIPIAGLLKGELGLDTVFMGFGLADDRVHSPNEKFELDCFTRGARSHVAMLSELRAL